MADYATGQVSVGTTATKVFSVHTPLAGGILVSSNAAAYIGGADVTKDNGFALPANTAVSVPAAIADNPPLELYAIVESGTATVSYIFPV